MSSFIDADALKSKEYKLPNGKTAVFEYDHNGIGKITLECLDELMAMITDKLQRWIPCNEGMPEYRKTVLISTFWGVKTGFLDSTEAYGDFWEIIEDDATVALHSVYAWMPLPEPWKGADDE